MSEWLQIEKDGEVNVQDIMHQIKDHLIRQRLAGTEFEGPFSGGRLFDLTVYDELAAVTRHSEQAYFAPIIRKSRLPVVGWFLNAFRRKMHELIVFYINQSVLGQAAFNLHVGQFLSMLVKELDSKSVTRAEVEALAEQVQVLKAQLEMREGS